MSNERPSDRSQPANKTLNRRNILLAGTTLAAASAMAANGVVRTAQAQANGKKPNILMIMADDIGWFNVSAYNLGLMGYRTPNIGRIGKEGAIFTDWYGEQSCTAGRSSFITGQSVERPERSSCGPNLLPSFESRSFTTFMPIRLNGPTSRPTPIGTG